MDALVNLVTAIDFWVSAGVIACTYGIFTIGLQLNAGNTGIFNFGQTGFMAIGAYVTAVLVADFNASLYLAIPAAVAAAVAAGLLVGLPSLRLRGDYFAITTLAFAELVRIAALNLDSVTGGPQGVLVSSQEWATFVFHGEESLRGIGIDPPPLLILLLIAVTLYAGLTWAFQTLRKTPWGRVVRAIKDDEESTAAAGKNVLRYKLQSLALSAALAASAGVLLTLNLSYVSPEQFLPAFTFLGYTAILLGGFGSYVGAAVGTAVLWVLLEATRFLDLPLSASQTAAMRFIVVGALLMTLVVIRPQGLLGKREEMVLRA